MKRLLCFIMAILVAGTVVAQRVTMNEAMQAANNFLRLQQKSASRCAKVLTENRDTLLYIVNADNAFVVVSGDKRVQPILAFSDHQPYNDSDVIPPVLMWLDNYRQQMVAVKAMPYNSSDVDPGWYSQSPRSVNSVEPLMRSHWDQGEFYNYYCPRDYAGANNRTLTGCVATALGQLIYYYRFPSTGVGSYTYVDSTYGPQYADYGNTVYDYSAMCDDPTSINPAISTLIYHCGVGVDMVYGVDGSGMYNHSAAYVLRTYFKYSPDTRYIFRDSTDLDWDSLIVTNLEHNKPLYYAGWSVPNINGHGFICDGYDLVDSNYYYHFNFGWSGSYDGYFYTNNLKPGGSNFNLAQELIVDAYPDTTLYDYPGAFELTGRDTLTTPAGSFTDGSTSFENYSSNMDYTWVVLPEVQNSSSISVHLWYDLAVGDTLLIYRNNSTVPVYTLTDSSNTLDVNWNCDKIVVRFVSDDSLSGDGFKFNYQTNVGKYCTPMATYSSPSNTLTDGSGDADYLPLTTCTYRIMQSQYPAVKFHVNYLDLEENKDFLHFFKSHVADSNYLFSITGTMNDTSFVIESKRVAFIFETDAKNNGNGFELRYEAGHVGMEDVDANQLSIYPNPTREQLTVLHIEPSSILTIYDLLGKPVRSLEAVESTMVIPVDDLSAGVYLLRVGTKSGTKTLKFVKQ